MDGEFEKTEEEFNRLREDATIRRRETLMIGLNVLFEQAKEEKRSLTNLEQVVKSQKSAPSELQHHPRIRVIISKYTGLT